MDKSPGEVRSGASDSADPGRGGDIARLARVLEIAASDLAADLPLEPIRPDPEGLDGHAVFDAELAQALVRVEDDETRCHLEMLLRTLETLRRGRFGDAGADAIVVSCAPVDDSRA